jgi:hypothetical protein
MKKIILSLIAIVALALTTHAQAFEMGKKYISIGVGGASYFNISPSNNYTFNTLYSPLTFQFSVQGEFPVHKYVGVGFYTGLGAGAGSGGFGRSRFVFGGYYGYGTPQMTIPLGVLANFHFYQLIADKSGKDIKADKLDVYAGLSIGSGVGLFFPGGSVDPSILAWGGPHVGVRYFFNDKLGVNGELGYGKTFVNAGLTFKL